MKDTTGPRIIPLEEGSKADQKCPDIWSQICPDSDLASGMWVDFVQTEYLASKNHSKSLKKKLTLELLDITYLGRVQYPVYDSGIISSFGCDQWWGGCWEVELAVFEEKINLQCENIQN